MKLPRRRLLCAGGAVTLATLAPIAQAQTYSSRPVHLIEGFGAGGTPGILARLLGQWLVERLGQPFVVDKRSGATGKIATEAGVRASLDGDTLLLVVPANVIDVVFRDNLSYDFCRDIAPVAGIYCVSYIMDVHPSVPANTIPGFVAYAKSRPGKINMASAGTGTGTQIADELLKMTTGVDMVHVPYRGKQVYPDLLGGQVRVFFGPLQSNRGLVRAGLRGERLWFGVGAPRATPVEIVEKLNKEINAALVDPTVKAKLAEQGGELLPGSSAYVGKLIAGDTEKWGRVIQAANIKPG
jgi:tripartite-type tricarboxylate transporter receptor subunit TctC